MLVKIQGIYKNWSRCAQQMEKFWPSPSNEMKFQSVTLVMVAQKPSSIPVILSRCNTDVGDILPEIVHYTNVTQHLNVEFDRQCIRSR